MKRQFTKTVMVLLVAGLFSSGCKKDKKENTAPSVTTAAVTAVLATSATGGGNITGDGGAAVTSSGLCYSRTSQSPTTANDTTKTNVTSGSFTSQLKNLQPSSTYYVRAYATNSVGTSYGEVVSFSTGNGSPLATGVAITGKIEVGETLNVTYNYSDAENDAQDVAAFQWYKSNDAAGNGEVAISGATSVSYKLVAADEFKFIRVGVTAKAKTGTLIGQQVKSAFSVAVAAEPTTVTFSYNGQNVTYGIITSPTTGRKWLDRNLGAPNAPRNYDDFINFGDLFQWGRPADGHQLINRGATSGETTAKNGTTTTKASTDNPGNALFIVAGATSPFDWRSPQNNNLWQGVSGTNNPCPAGWRIPTNEEWAAEKITNLDEGYKKMKITFTGFRNSDGSGIVGVTSAGAYWSSTLLNRNNTGAYWAYNFKFNDYDEEPLSQDVRTMGASCRCIKN